MKTTHLALDDRERTLANMRASQLGMSLTWYVAHLIRKDADEAGLTEYLDGETARKEVDHVR